MHMRGVLLSGQEPIQSRVEPLARRQRHLAHAFRAELRQTCDPFHYHSGCLLPAASPRQNVRTPIVTRSSTRIVSFTTYGSPYFTPIRLP